MSKINLHDLSEEVLPIKNGMDFGDFSQINNKISSSFNKRIEDLNKYLVLAENPSDFNNESKRLGLFGNLSFGLRKAAEGLSLALYYQKMAKSERKKAEASAALDQFGQYIADQKDLGKDVKATDKTKEYYVSLNDGVLKASEYEAMMDAYVEYFSAIRYEFGQAISTLRALCFGMKDSNNISSYSGTME